MCVSLRRCLLSSSCCRALSSALSSHFSSLTHLNLGYNDLEDSGVELLCAGLRSPRCSVDTLRLNACHVSGSSCGPLSSVLMSPSSRLTLLDLSFNNLKDAGVGLLCAGLKSAPCRLETLRLSYCNLQQGSCGSLSSALAASRLTELDLSDNCLKDAGVELLCAGLKSASCRLETLGLSGCVVSEVGGAALASAVSSAHSHLKELDLSYNHPGPSTKLLTHLRIDSRFPLETLWLNPSGAQWLTPGLKKYFLLLSLDVNSAHRALQLSPDQRTVTHVQEQRPYPDHPDRFLSRPQILSSTALTRKCYWEVSAEGCGPDEPGWADVTVCYKTLPRKGDEKECLFGLNADSWTLSVFKGRYSFRHNGREVRLGPVSPSCRVAVYVDPKCGYLTFYEASTDGLHLTFLHSLNTTFSKTLVAGFGAFCSSVHLV